VNYLKEINAFYDWLETNSIPDSAIVLWHALMHICNKAGWVTEFAVAISTLEAKTGLKKGAIIRARQRLQQEGRIDFKSRSGQQSAIYAITAFEVDCVPKKNTNRNTNRTQSGTQTGRKVEPLYKLNKTKLKDNIYSVFAHWNSKGIITHKSLSDKMKGHINARLEKFTPEEIMEAIDNYAMVLHGEEYFWSYKWGLGEFLTRENGFEKFLSVNKPLVNYLKKGGQADASNRGNSKNTDVDWDNYDPDASRWTDE